MLLTHTSKMPCASFSLEACKNCPVAQILLKRLAQGEKINPVCKICYARRGRYRFNNVIMAQRKRKAFILRSIRNDGGKTFVARMIKDIEKTAVNLFRIHDAGDMFSTKYLQLWISICAELKHVKFRCPTREWATDDREKSLVLRQFAKLPNVALQPSALCVDDEAPHLRSLGYASGTTVITRRPMSDEYVCPTTIKDNPKSCHENNCFMCWDKKSTSAIAYIQH